MESAKISVPHDSFDFWHQYRIVFMLYQLIGVSYCNIKPGVGRKIQIVYNSFIFLLLIFGFVKLLSEYNLKTNEAEEATFVKILYSVFWFLSIVSWIWMQSIQQVLHEIVNLIEKSDETEALVNSKIIKSLKVSLK